MVRASFDLKDYCKTGRKAVSRRASFHRNPDLKRVSAAIACRREFDGGHDKFNMVEGLSRRFPAYGCLEALLQAMFTRDSAAYRRMF